MALADVEEILKHDYKNMTNLLNDSVVLSAQLERNTDSIHGDYAVIAMEVGREFGVGARLEGDVMPAGRSVAPESANVKVKRVYGRYRMTRAEVEAMSTDTGAFVRAQPRRIKNLMGACTRDMARQTWSDGAGHVAQCGTTVASATVQLAADTAEQALINIAEGMQVDIGTNADPQLIASDRTVTAVDFDNATITISGAVVSTTNVDFVFRQGSGGAPGTATQRELTGIANLVDDTAICQGVNPASVWNWAAYVSENGGTLRLPSENLLESALHRYENRSGAKIDAWYAGDGVFRALVNALKGRQRVVNDISLKGGHTGIDFTFGAESVPLVRDRDETAEFPNSLVGIEHSSLSSYIQKDWGWEDLDGQILRLATDGTHAYEAIYFTFRELGVEQRNHNLRIDDLETA